MLSLHVNECYYRDNKILFFYLTYFSCIIFGLNSYILNKMYLYAINVDLKKEVEQISMPI